MIEKLKRIAAAVLAAVIALPLQQAPVWAAAVTAASSAEPVTLDGLDVGEDTVRVSLSGESSYTHLVTASPPRIIIQFENTQYQAGSKILNGKGKFLKSVRSSQFATTPTLLSRVVLDLNEMTGFKIDRKGSEVVVTLGGASPAPAQASAKPAIKPKPRVSASAVAPAAAPTAVSSTPQSRVGEGDGMTTMPSEELAEMADRGSVSQSDSAAPERTQPTTSLAAVDKPRVARGDIMGRLPKDLVTLDFDNTDIKDVLKLLAAKAKINLIYGPDVTGTLTLHLTDVPFGDAFRTILTMMGFSTMQIGDNILRVLTPGVLTKSQTASPSFTKVIPLNYAKATDLFVALNSVRVAEGRTGTTIADIKTNSLIVTESVEGMLSTERLIAQLDVRPKQVMIEAKLIEVGLSNQLSYGIQWDYTMAEQGRVGGQQGTNVIGSPIGRPGGATTLPNPLDLGNNVANQGAGQGIGTAARGTGVGLPSDKVFGVLTLGRITNNYFVNATIAAAASQGKVKVLSDPKITTLNNQPANISVTTQIPFVTSNVASTGVTTQQVSVTPSINADGRIMLTINPSVSQPSAASSAPAGTTGAVATDTRATNTTVLVKDGETVVIGGLISDAVNNTISKVPILGDIPILGWLFKKKTITRARSELLIFVTPKVMPD
jgi:type IV pilus secretin PilQ/predicted competence protein